MAQEDSSGHTAASLADHRNGNADIRTTSKDSAVGGVNRVKSLFTQSGRQKRKSSTISLRDLDDFDFENFLTLPSTQDSSPFLADAILSHVQETLSTEFTSANKHDPVDKERLELKVSQEKDTESQKDEEEDADSSPLSITKSPVFTPIDVEIGSPSLREKINEMIKIHEFLLTDTTPATSRKDNKDDGTDASFSEAAPAIALPSSPPKKGILASPEQAQSIIESSYLKKHNLQVSTLPTPESLMAPKKPNPSAKTPAKTASPGSADRRSPVYIPTEDPKTFWVPAHLHPELNPSEYRSWLSEQAKFDVDGYALTNPDQFQRRKSVKRTKSYIDSHIVVTPDSISDFLEYENVAQQQQQPLSSPVSPSSLEVPGGEGEAKKKRHSSDRRHILKNRRSLMKSSSSSSSIASVDVSKLETSLDQTISQMAQPEFHQQLAAKEEGEETQAKFSFASNESLSRKKSWTPSDDHLFKVDRTRSSATAEPLSSTTRSSPLMEDLQIPSINIGELANEDLRVREPLPPRRASLDLERHYQPLNEKTALEVPPRIHSISEPVNPGEFVFAVDDQLPKVGESPNPKRSSWGWISNILSIKKKPKADRRKSSSSSVSSNNSSLDRIKNGAYYPANEPIRDEKYVYQMSNTKLMDLRRPLTQQVLISNLMLSILAMHADVALSPPSSFVPVANKKPKSARRKSASTPRKSTDAIRKPGRASVEIKRDNAEAALPEKPAPAERKISRPIIPAQPLIKLDIPPESLVAENLADGVPQRQLTPSPVNGPALDDDEDDDVPLGMLQTLRSPR